MFVVISKFTVDNKDDMTGAVKRAYSERPHLVEITAGFVRLDVISPIENPNQISVAQDGVYANLTTLLILAMIIIGLVASHIIAETSFIRLKKSESQIEYQANLLKYINDAVIAVDEAFHITAWNKAAERIYGWQADEVLGRLSTEIVRSEMTKEERELALIQLHEAGFYRSELVQFNKDGSAINIEANTIAIYENKKFTGILSVNRDISERSLGKNLAFRMGSETADLRANL